MYYGQGMNQGGWPANVSSILHTLRKCTEKMRSPFWLLFSQLAPGVHWTFSYVGISKFQNKTRGGATSRYYFPAVLDVCEPLNIFMFCALTSKKKIIYQSHYISVTPVTSNRREALQYKDDDPLWHLIHWGMMMINSKYCLQSSS